MRFLRFLDRHFDLARSSAKIKDLSNLLSRNMGFWKLAWEYFSKSFGAFTAIVGTLLGITLSLLAWVFKADQPVPLGHVALCLCILISLATLLLVMVYKLLCDFNNDHSLVVNQILKPEHLNPSGRLPAKVTYLILAQPSGRDFVGSRVAVYCLKDDLEIPIDRGIVFEQQKDGQIQIQVECLTTNQYLEAALNGPDAKKQIIVKTSFSNTFVDALLAVT